MVELKTLMFTILAPAALVERGGDDYSGVTAGLSLEEFERAALSHPLFVFGREEQEQAEEFLLFGSPLLIRNRSALPILPPGLRMGVCLHVHIASTCCSHTRRNAMRKVIVSEFVSLDGVAENPAWTFQFGSEEQEQYKFAELFACDALLLGRVTYQGFATAWPNMQGTGAYGERINRMPKYVASTTLTQLEWNASLIQGDLAEAVSRLKHEGGQDLLVFGSCEQVYTLTQLDLIDEYRLMVFPIVLGSGKRVFRDGSEQKTLKLVETTTFASGVVVLSYEPVAKSDK